MRIKTQGLRVTSEKLMAVLVFALLYRGNATASQGIFSVSYWDKYIVGVICCVIVFIALILKHSLKYTVYYHEKKLFIWLLCPFVIALVYSMLLYVISPVEYPGYITRSLSNMMFPLLSMLEALMIYKYFGKKSIYIMFTANVASYMTSIVVAFIQGGLTQFIALMTDSTYVGTVLEMHELNPTFCLFALYFLYEYRYRGLGRKKMIIAEFFCILFMIIDAKRIVILTMVAALILYFAIRKHTKSLINYSQMISTFLITVCLIYIFSIRSGVFYEFTDWMDINTMSRNTFWSAIESEYNFSPLYYGRGLGYVSKWMDANWQSMNIIGMSGTTGLHNDVLKYYIEFGFFGFIVFFYWLLAGVTKKISKLLDKKSAVIYFLLTVAEILIWFTDNISGYHIFMAAFYLILFNLINDAKNIQYTRRIVR